MKINAQLRGFVGVCQEVYQEAAHEVVICLADGETWAELFAAMGLQVVNKPLEAVAADCFEQCVGAGGRCSQPDSGSPGRGNAGRSKWIRRAPRNFLGRC